jgi:hypothetical protein
LILHNYCNTLIAAWPVFESLIACLLAAAESGREAYSGQFVWIDEIRRLPSWPEGGMVYWVNFRDQNKEINGWPNSLAHTCTIAWHFLDSIIENWSLVRYANGSPERSKEGIAAYYLLLDFLAFVSKAKEVAWDNDPHSSPIKVPQLFFAWPQDTVHQGYQCFLRQMPLLRRVLKANNVDDSNFEIRWKLWHSEIQLWLTNVLPGRFPAPVPNNALPTDLSRDDLVL